MVKEMKIVQPLNLKPKSLNQVFVIIQTILVAVISSAGDITATRGVANTSVAFKNYATFTKCITQMFNINA